MNLWPFHKPTPQPNHVVIRHVVATKAENRAVQHKRAMKRLELQFMSDLMSPEERAAARLRASLRTDKQKAGE